MIRRIALATTAVTVAALTTGITWSSSADAVTPTPVPYPADVTVAVPLGQYTGMAVDQADGLVFLSGVTNNFINDGFGGGIAAAHLDGSQMTKISGTTDALSVTLGPDGKIYAAESSGNVAVIDPATLAVTSTVPTGADGCPTSIAFAGATLWFSYSCGANGTSGIASLDPTSGTVTDGLSRTQSNEILLRSVPGHSDELLASGLGQQNNALDLLAISQNTLTVAAEQAGVNASDLTYSPDGQTVLVANGTGSTYSAADLSPASLTYPVGSASSIAVSADGASVAVGAGQAGEPDYIASFAAGSTTTIHSYDTKTPGSAGPGENVIPQRRGLAWTDGALLAVYADYGGSYVVLKVLNSVLQAPTSMTFTGPASATRTGHATVSGQLPADLASTPVTISRRDLSGTHTLASVNTDSAGKFSYTDAPGIGGTNTYTASYGGDKTHGPVTKSLNVAVSRQTVTMSIALDHSSYNYHQIAHLAIHVASHNQKTVQVWAKFGHEPLHLLRTLNLDSRGVAHMDSMLTYDTLYQLRFAGDYVYNPRTISVTAYTRVAMAAGLAGAYGTSGAYHLFHASGYAYIYTRVAPDKTGRCVRLETQYWYNGRWNNGSSLACDSIESGSTAYGVFHGASGLPYRVRAVYGTEVTNLSNATGYLYLMFH